MTRVHAVRAGYTHTLTEGLGRAPRAAEIASGRLDCVSHHDAQSSPAPRSCASSSESASWWRRIRTREMTACDAAAGALAARYIVRFC